MVLCLLKFSKKNSVQTRNVIQHNSMLGYKIKKVAFLQFFGIFKNHELIVFYYKCCFPFPQTNEI